VSRSPALGGQGPSASGGAGGAAGNPGAAGQTGAGTFGGASGGGGGGSGRIRINTKSGTAMIDPNSTMSPALQDPSMLCTQGIAQVQ